MRVIIFFLTLFSIPSLHAQSIGIYFPEIVFDFGYVMEAQGKVYHTFHFSNNGKETVEIKEIATSCGCMLPRASGKKLEPGEKGFIQVEYDPEGRPGKFIKSIEVVFSSSSFSEQKFLLNIKGIVIGKEVLPAFKEDWKQTQLQIKPFKAIIVSASDFRFLNQPDLQTFINDITYEIDLNGFSTVELEILIPKGKKLSEPADQLFLPAKKYLISELRRRNYSQNQIGFLEKGPTPSFQINSDAVGIIRIASRDLNNDSIPESGFFFRHTDQRNHFRELEKLQRSEDSLKAVRSGIRNYSQSTIKSIDVKSDHFRSFIEQVIRQVLINNTIVIAARIESAALPDKIEKEKNALKKQLLVLSKQFLNSCKEEGIPEGKIIFSVPAIIVHELSEKKLPEKKLSLTLFTRFSQEDHFDLVELLANDTTRKRFSPIVSKTGYAPPFQDLPSYQQYFNTPAGIFDTTKTDFKLWTKVILDELRIGKKIRFLIESSNSNAPLYGKFDNLFIARRRSKEVTEQLTFIFSKTNFPSQIRFETPLNQVQGPPYDTRIWGVSLYDKYQYIKILPMYDTIPETKSELFPYQVNFNYNYFELPSRSEIFQVFVTRLLPEIENKGYIRLIVESCSSHVPADNYTSNETLSYYRAENSKYKLREEIRKRGYDPRRLVFVETRALVQGPKYKRGDDTKSSVFENFQYIKIFPESMIKK
ncbi:MAG: DUF1573 domain-containing protein [Flavobacteriales bacterium]